MIDKILVTLDGSELAELVLPEVEKLATKRDVEVTLLQVIAPISYKDQPNGGPAVHLDELVAQAIIEAKDYLKKVAENLRQKGINVKIAARYGYVADQIVDFASKNRIDLIAMSTHGRSGISRWIHGSIAETVMRSTRTPVFLVKPTSGLWARRGRSKEITMAAN